MITNPKALKKAMGTMLVPETQWPSASGLHRGRHRTRPGSEGFREPVSKKAAVESLGETPETNGEHTQLKERSGASGKSRTMGEEQHGTGPGTRCWAEGLRDSRGTARQGGAAVTQGSHDIGHPTAEEKDGPLSSDLRKGVPV